jgi:hypothetical protein
MAFKLTYRNGQEDDYDDGTEWTVEGGVLKMGREPGNWTVLVSPGHWATIELREDQDKGKDEEDQDKDDDKDDDEEDDDKHKDKHKDN